MHKVTTIAVSVAILFCDVVYIKQEMQQVQELYIKL